MANSVDEAMMKSVFLITAMEEEAMPIILELNLQKIIPSPFQFGLPAVAWKGNVGNLTLHLIWCGRYVKYMIFLKYLIVVII